MIKEIQDKILALIPKDSLEFKMVSEPIIDFVNIRQQGIINLQFDGVSFVNINTNKAILQRLPTKSQVQDINFSLYYYYKDLRKGYDVIHRNFFVITNALHGEIITLESGIKSTPLIIENIEFVERNSNSFLVYKSSFSIRIRSSV